VIDIIYKTLSVKNEITKEEIEKMNANQMSKIIDWINKQIDSNNVKKNDEIQNDQIESQKPENIREQN